MTLSLFRKIMLLASLPFVFTSCMAAVPPATSYAIGQKLDALKIGMAKDYVLSQFSPPQYEIKLTSGIDGGLVEVVGYEIGNAFHHETCMLIFKDQALRGIAQDGYELLQLLYALKAIPSAQFHKYFYSSSAPVQDTAVQPQQASY